MQNKLDILIFTLLVLLASAILSSCRKEPSLSPAGDEAISFHSSVGDTKALVNEVTDMEGFKVYGYYTTDNGQTESTAFDGVEVSRSGALWTYSPARYWIDKAEYSFAAVHPSDASVTIVNSDLNTNGEFTGLSFVYTKKNFHDDFMLAVSSMASADAASNDYTVQLPFVHILANIKVNIGLGNHVQNGTSIRLKSVMLNGMKNHATYTYGSGWSDLSSTALQFSGNIDNVQLNKRDGQIYNNETLLPDGVISPTGEDGLTVIPIDLTDKGNTVTLRLNCEVSIDYGTTFTQKIIEKTFVATSGVNAWEEGKSYTYTALLDVDYTISFSEPTVTDWVDEQATGSVIIK